MPTEIEANAIRDRVAQHFVELRDRVYWYLRRQRDELPSDAEEITQEAFLRLHRTLMQGEQIRDVLFWTLAVARRVAVDRRRHSRYESPAPASPPDVLDAKPTCEDDLVMRASRRAVRLALSDLTSLQRTCLELRARGLSLSEVGVRVNASPSSVSNAVSRALVRIRQHSDLRGVSM